MCRSRAAQIEKGSPQPRKLPCNTHMKRPPCAKGAVAKRLRDCPAIILQDHQIGSMFIQFLRHGCAAPPPFAQRRLMKEMEAYAAPPPFAGGRHMRLERAFNMPVPFAQRRLGLGSVVGLLVLGVA